MAALAVACRIGFELDNALEIARDTYVDVDIHRPENAARLESLDHLPASCAESADCMEAMRDSFESRQVFSPRLINDIIAKLRTFADDETARTDEEKMKTLVHRYFHCG